MLPFVRKDKKLLKKLSTFPNRRFQVKLEAFSFSLDRVFGYENLDRGRNLLSKLTYNIDTYQIPSEQLIHQEFDRIVFEGVNVITGTFVENVNKTFKILEDKSLNYFNLKSINGLRKFPIFKGILNHIRNLEKVLNNFDFSRDLLQLSKELIVLDLDNVFNKERNKVLDMLNVGKSLNKGLRILRTPSEPYNMSSNRQVFDNAQMLHGGVQGKLDLLLLDLESVNKGTYRKMKLKEFSFSMF